MQWLSGGNPTVPTDPSAMSVVLLSLPHHSVPESSHRRWPPTPAMAVHSALPTVRPLVLGVLGWARSVARLCCQEEGEPGEPTVGRCVRPETRKYLPGECQTARVRTDRSRSWESPHESASGCRSPA